MGHRQELTPFDYNIIVGTRKMGHFTSEVPFLQGFYGPTLAIVYQEYMNSGQAFVTCGHP